MLAKIWAIRLGCLVATIGLWQVACTAGWANPKVLPAPGSVVSTLIHLLGNAKFIDNALTTLGRVLLAFAIGVPISVFAGFLIAEKESTARTVGPAVFFLMGVPQSIFLPVFIQVFGVGTVEKVVFGITHIVFVLTAITMAASQSTSPQLVMAARSFGASRMRIYTSIYFRSMLPVLINGFRLALIFSVIGILSAEMFASRSGLGQLMMAWGEDYKTEPLMAAVLLVSVTTIALNELMSAIQRAVTNDSETNAIQGTG